MSRSGEIVLAFGMAEHPCRLDIKRWERLDEELEVGPSVLLARLAVGETQAVQVLSLFPALRGEISRFRAKEPRIVVLQGLIGGGMELSAATKVLQAAEADGGPLALVVLAYQIVLAGISGVTVENAAGEPVGAQADSAPSQTDASGSEKMASTPSEPPPASRRGKSTPAPSGSSPQP